MSRAGGPAILHHDKTVRRPPLGGNYNSILRDDSQTNVRDELHSILLLAVSPWGTYRFTVQVVQGRAAFTRIQRIIRAPDAPSECIAAEALICGPELAIPIEAFLLEVTSQMHVPGMEQSRVLTFHRTWRSGISAADGYRTKSPPGSINLASSGMLATYGRTLLRMEHRMIRADV